MDASLCGDPRTSRWASGRLVTLLVAIVFSYLVGAARADAWDTTAHELVTSIAFYHLSPEGQRLFALWTHTLPAGYTPVSCACWLDDLQRRGAIDFTSWHSFDWGVTPGDAPPPVNIKNTETTNSNLVAGLNRAVEVLNGGEDAAIRALATQRALPEQTVAFMILSNLIADIEQPLHCATYIFPDGTTDQGGEAVAIEGQPDLNLHAFWECAYRAHVNRAGQAYLETTDIDRTIGSIGRNPDTVIPRIKEIDDSVSEIVPDEGMPDFIIWASQSHQVAINKIYGEIPFDDAHSHATLSQTYVAEARTIACQQLKLAAYRLAATINWIASKR